MPPLCFVRVIRLSLSVSSRLFVRTALRFASAAAASMAAATTSGNWVKGGPRRLTACATSADTYADAFDAVEYADDWEIVARKRSKCRRMAVTIRSLEMVS